MKKNRHDKIIEIINNHVVETQEQLAALLKDEGYDVTQATVSRDIRQMKLTKQVTPDGRQKYVYTTADPEVMHDKYVRILKAGFVSMDLAQNLLVVRTVSGMAMALAAAIDSLEMVLLVMTLFLLPPSPKRMQLISCMNLTKWLAENDSFGWGSHFLER